MLVLCIFLKILIVSDKISHRAFRTHRTLYTTPIRENFHFNYLPELCIGFILSKAGIFSSNHDDFLLKSYISIHILDESYH